MNDRNGRSSADYFRGRIDETLTLIEHLSDPSRAMLLECIKAYELLERLTRQEETTRTYMLRSKVNGNNNPKKG